MLELDTQGRQQVIYFVGTEVENTAMKNEKTLFVVGVRPVEEIIKHATDNKLRHLYFGTSQTLEWSLPTTFTKKAGMNSLLSFL
jgi:hypothetical protein